MPSRKVNQSKKQSAQRIELESQTKTYSTEMYRLQKAVLFCQEKLEESKQYGVELTALKQKCDYLNKIKTWEEKNFGSALKKSRSIKAKLQAIQEYLTNSAQIFRWLMDLLHKILRANSIFEKNNRCFS